eukprot:2671503-Heterocapsa_arctica.AAC.1
MAHIAGINPVSGPAGQVIVTRLGLHGKGNGRALSVLSPSLPLGSLTGRGRGGPVPPAAFVTCIVPGLWFWAPHQR